MKAVVEGDLELKVPDGAAVRKFDAEHTHGLSHCMKAVDFIIEWKDRIFFVEFKDPEAPESRPKDRRKFLHQFLAGQIDADLKTKYRDTFLYEWGFLRAEKPIHYLVLIAVEGIGPAELLNRTDALKRQLPLMGPFGQEWPRPFVAGCVVLNLAAWNRQLPQFPVRRLTSSHS
ncbi:MAG: hypothetical protein WHS86_13285 [Desulfosoma sp.]